MRDRHGGPDGLGIFGTGRINYDVSKTSLLAGVSFGLADVLAQRIGRKVIVSHVRRPRVPSGGELCSVWTPLTPSPQSIETNIL